MLKRKKPALLAPPPVKPTAADAKMNNLSRRLLMARMQPYQSSSVLTLDTSSASTIKDESTSSQMHEPLEMVASPPLSFVQVENTPPSEVPRRGTGSSLKVKTQDESLGGSFRTRTTCRSSLCSEPEDARSVSWCTIEFQTYEIILGDNPATSRGPPLSIGKALDRTILSLADYEEQRPPRRTMSDLIVPHATRERLLMDAGYSRADLYAMEDKLLRIKLARKANATEGVLEKARKLWGKKHRTIAATQLLDRK